MLPIREQEGARDGAPQAEKAQRMGTGNLTLYESCRRGSFGR
jgi:hypothetical protein